MSIGVITAVTLFPNADTLFARPDALFPDSAGQDHGLSIATEPREAVLTFEGIAPGDSVTDDIVVSNTGGVPLRYAVTVTSTDDDGKGLREVLILTIRTEDATSQGCKRLDGVLLYEGPVSRAAVGDPFAGENPGDRPLAPGATETLCLRAELPIEGGGVEQTHQGAVTTITFVFAAEHAEEP